MKLLRITILVLLSFLSISNAYALTTSGTIADGGSGWNYIRITSDVFCPNAKGVTITGTIDLTNIGHNNAVGIGLVDKEYYDDGYSNWWDGAYAYFGYRDDATWGPTRVGPSDGQAGGEFVQVFGKTTDLVIDFTATFYNNTISVSFDGSGPYVDTYGDIEYNGVADVYPWDEFEYGAYFGIDLWAPGGSVDYDLTITGEPCGVIPAPGAILLGGLGVGLVGWLRRRSML